LKKLEQIRKHKVPLAVTGVASLILGTMFIRSTDEPAHASATTTFNLSPRHTEAVSRDLVRESLAAAIARVMVDRAAFAPKKALPAHAEAATNSIHAQNIEANGINGYWFGEPAYLSGLIYKTTHGNPNALRNAQILYEVGKAEGLTTSEIGDLEDIAYRESGINATAGNPNQGAYGIPQSSPGDKMASMGPGWLTDPATQVKWMIHYVDSTYGGPAEAWIFWQDHLSY